MSLSRSEEGGGGQQMSPTLESNFFQQNSHKTNTLTELCFQCMKHYCAKPSAQCAGYYKASNSSSLDANPFLSCEGGHAAVYTAV